MLNISSMCCAALFTVWSVTFIDVFSAFRFSHAALAFEGCGSKYRAVFAEPKNSSRSSNNSSTDRGGSRFDDSFNTLYGNNSGNSAGSSSGGMLAGAAHSTSRSSTSDYSSFFNSAVVPSSSAGGGDSKEVQLNIICSSSVNQDQLWRLFDIVPGLEYCQITGECSRNSNYATATYNNFHAAQYAR